MIYQPYEFLVIFAFYSILGYMFTILCRQLNLIKNVREGIIYGPFCMSYGVGAILLTIISQHYVLDPISIFLEGIILGTIIEILAGYINGIISGKRKKFYKIYHSIIWGLLSVIVLMHWNNLIIAIIRYVEPWINMIVLLIIYIKIVTGFVDGISQLYDERKTCTKEVIEE